MYHVTDEVWRNSNYIVTREMSQNVEGESHRLGHGSSILSVTGRNAYGQASSQMDQRNSLASHISLDLIRSHMPCYYNDQGGGG